MHSPLEVVFRGILFTVFLALVVLWCGAFLKAGIEAGAFFGKREGLVVAIAVRLLLATSIVGIILYAVEPDAMQWSYVPVHWSVRLVGLPLCVLALLLFYSAQRSLGNAFSPSPRIKRESVLVMTGPYRVVRHPMYVAFLISWIGYGLLAANWFIGIAGVSAECLIMFFRTSREEAMLVAAFGDDYIRYSQRTGRFWPRLKHFRGPAINRA